MKYTQSNESEVKPVSHISECNTQMYLEKNFFSEVIEIWQYQEI